MFSKKISKNFSKNFGPKWPKFGPEIFFQPQDHQYLIDIMPVYHNMQNQTNLMIQTPENDQKPQIWAKLSPFCPILGQDIFFSKNRRVRFLPL